MININRSHAIYHALKDMHGVKHKTETRKKKNSSVVTDDITVSNKETTCEAEVIEQGIARINDENSNTVQLDEDNCRDIVSV